MRAPDPGGAGEGLDTQVHGDLISCTRSACYTVDTESVSLGAGVLFRAHSNSAPGKHNTGSALDK